MRHVCMSCRRWTILGWEKLIHRDGCRLKNAGQDGAASELTEAELRVLGVLAMLPSWNTEGAILAGLYNLDGRPQTEALRRFVSSGLAALERAGLVLGQQSKIGKHRVYRLSARGLLRIEAEIKQEGFTDA